MLPHAPATPSARLLEGLNPEQLAAVTLPPEPALILAGAGSGKTRVLTTRIAWLIQTGQVSPGGVLAVTFTNKAAKEMLTRLGAMLPINVRGMWIGTFHGLCNRFLRAHWKLAGAAAGLPDPRLGRPALGGQARDQGDEPRRGALRAEAGDAGSSPAPRKRPARRRTSRSRDEQTRKHGRRSTRPTKTQCQREGVVDFAELMLRTYELLRDNDRAARALPAALPPRAGRRVPGHQPAAVRVAEDVRRPARARQRVFAVGDDDQSIYAFRGAQVGNMAEFEREYRRASR